MIEFSHVYKVYPGPVRALNNINLKIEKGEFVFLTGPSGAGKTTLFKLLSAHDQPTSGKGIILGNHLNSLNYKTIPLLRRQIGVIYQDFRLLKNKTVFENVALPLEIKSERTSFVQERVSVVLNEVGLEHKKNDYPERLSGGEQQRVAIARALVHRPALLIADEPTGNLDPDLSLEILSLFERMNDQGTTVVIATHDKNLVQKSNKRQIRLSHGALEV